MWSSERLVCVNKIAMKISVLVVLFVSFAVLLSAEGRASTASDVNENKANGNNWALLVCASRWWYNYRHAANTLSIYRTVKRLGIPDSQIILMLADDMACDVRNREAAAVFNSREKLLNLYGDDVDIEVDYRGYDVNVENFLRLLSGRHEPSTQKSKRLLTDSNSNLLVYLTGHGGDEFLKFQDAEEIKSQDIADAFEQMRLQQRFRNIFFMADTCQAATLYSRFYTPNIIAVGSSQLGENSYSHQSDRDLGVALIDRFTYFALEFLESVNVTSDRSLADLSRHLNTRQISSTVGWRTDLFSRPLDQVLLTEFFGAVQSIQPTPLTLQDLADIQW